LSRRLDVFARNDDHWRRSSTKLPLLPASRKLTRYQPEALRGSQGPKTPRKEPIVGKKPIHSFDLAFEARERRGDLQARSGAPIKSPKKEVKTINCDKKRQKREKVCARPAAGPGGVRA
jgi:hypothetical protein